MMTNRLGRSTVEVTELGFGGGPLGDLLRGKPRAEYTLSTKVGRLLVPQDPAGRTDESFEVPATHRRVWDFSRDGIRRSVDDSLARLCTGRIDMLFLHDAEDHFEAALRDGYPALAELRAQGVVGAIGGMRSAAEVRHNVELFGAGVPAQVWAYLRDEGLLDERAPVSP